MSDNALLDDVMLCAESNDFYKHGSVGGRRLWRKSVKKLQRKKRRQRQAKERDKLLEIESLDKQKDPLYTAWLEHQEELKLTQLREKEKEHDEQEEAWLRRELLAQQNFKKLEKLQKVEEAAKEAVRLHKEAEFQKRQKSINLKNAAERRLIESANKEFENTMRLMDDYLTETITRTPPKLNVLIETAPSRTICEFFERTNCCRFGFTCNFNHKRPLLAKIIIIRNFFNHPLLKHRTEYAEHFNADEQLEFSENDLENTYQEFCKDVWPEIEKFGEIVNFRVTRNVQNHLRGHTFVEYKNKRDALKAFINLQGRYYASQRLCVEFSNIQHWRIAVCGLSLGHKCSKGSLCNYLHLFQNPGNKYNQIIEPTVKTWKVVQNFNRIEATPLLSWKDIEAQSTYTGRCKNWRWSESPELDITTEQHSRDKGTNHKTENLSKLNKKIRKSSKSNSKKRSKEREDKYESRRRNRSRSKSRKKHYLSETEVPHRKRSKKKSSIKETSKAFEKQSPNRKSKHK
uniref:Uncharacterized protein n=1 Tax=Glossina brevipalpis TaxID=37001 RepID=A0A1A9WAL6_9MUSC